MTGKNYAGLLLACAVLASCGGGDPPQVPSALEAAGGTTVTGAVNTAVATAPSVTLKDANGKGIAGVFVRFTATGGGKPANDSVKTGGNGVASSGGWTLGTMSGTQTLTASGAGFSVTFTANAAAGPAVRLVRNIADPQTGVVNTNVPVAPSAKALDNWDNPVPGVNISFNIINGGGSVAGSPKTTGPDGIATVDSWKLGTTAGQQLLRADALGVSIPAAFSATAVAGPPTTIAIVAGNNVSGVVGSSLASFATLPTVKVTDQFGNPVVNVPITFTPGLNSGTITGGTVNTNDAGIAIVGGWILGTGATQTLVATSTLIPSVQATFTVTALQTQFNITIRYVGAPPSARQQLAVTRAVDKWKSVLVNSSGTSTVNVAAGNCGRAWTPAVNELVTNLLILANIGPIDGVGNTLGNGNACILHGATGLPVLGSILFDSDDLTAFEANGLIDPLVFHEMGHTLGFGTIWTLRGVLTDPAPNFADPIFNGVTANAQFQLIGGNLYTGRPVPVENTGGPGTWNAHWRESVFRSEVMTGFVNNGFNPLSRASVGAMQDIGYAVSYTGTDAFTIAATLLLPPTAPAIALGNDIAYTPLFFTDRQGRMTPVVPPPKH